MAKMYIYKYDVLISINYNSYKQILSFREVFLNVSVYDWGTKLCILTVDTMS